MFSRVIEGARPALRFALSIVALGFMPGVAVGLILTRAPARIAAFVARLSLLPMGMAMLPVVMVGAHVRLSLAWAIGLAAAIAFFAGVRVVASRSSLGELPVAETIRQTAPSIVASAVQVLGAAVLLHSMLGWLGFDPLEFESPNWGADSRRAAFGFPIHYPSLLFPSAALALVLLGCATLAESLDGDKLTQ